MRLSCTIEVGECDHVPSVIAWGIPVVSDVNMGRGLSDSKPVYTYSFPRCLSVLSEYVVNEETEVICPKLLHHIYRPSTCRERI
jgi:hypothetical protein